MHLGIRTLLDFYHQHRGDDALVLVCIARITGSSYRKPGALMLIARDNSYAGMISGGCLEADLLLHAEQVFASGTDASLTYDLHAKDELPWGFKLGCNGVVHLHLKYLDRKHGFPLLDFIQTALDDRSPVLLALQTSVSEAVAGSAGHAALMLSGEGRGDAWLQQICQQLVAGQWPDWRQKLVSLPGTEVSVTHIKPPPRVLLCGGGPDSIAMASLVIGLGWECVIADHRPAFATASRFPPGCRVILCRPAALAEHLDLATVDASVIMSHHLEHDAHYLQQLWLTSDGQCKPYIGLLGPVARRERVAELANCSAPQLYSPVGLDIGAELPESIALSVVAEIHAVLNNRDGHSLTRGSKDVRP